MENKCLKNIIIDFPINVEFLCELGMIYAHTHGFVSTKRVN